MRQLQRVLWSKGVMLNAQHLQLQDRYLEELLSHRVAALHYMPWGYSRLAVDGEALAGGALRLADAAGMLPDGFLFDSQHNGPPPPLPLAAHWRPDQEALLVYLALPEHREQGRNVAAAGGDARWIADVDLRRDEITGLAEKPVQVAVPNLRLIAEGEALEGTVAMPVARLLRGTAGVELDPHFIPPVLDIAASPVLLTLLRRLVELLSARSSVLAGMRRERSGALADFGTSDVGNFWLLYTVNTHLPRLRHLHETGRGHPAALYQALLELAGTLMTFAGGHPRELPAYVHDAPTSCFTELGGRVLELLESAVPARHAALPLRQIEPSVYATALDQERYLSAPLLYLAVASSLKKEELPQRVPALLKVSSVDQIERLIRHGLRGVGLTHVPVPPGAVPVKVNWQYFALECSGEDWEAVRLSRHLAVHVPAELPDVQLELVVLLPEG